MSTEKPKDTKVTPALPVNPAPTKVLPKFPLRWFHIPLGCGALMLLFFMVVCFLPTPHYKTGFRTLSELQEHAATLDEWIKMENDNILIPSYQNYYLNTFTRTFWLRWKEKCVWLLSRLRIMRQPPFSSSFFKTVLEDVLQMRLKKGWTGDIIQKFQVKPTSKIVVFGVTQGALHSLTRDLEQLKKLDIIDEHLKLKKSDYYIVFLGNVVNRSPYTLDTLGIVLRLLQENPNNVIYLRGSHEFFDTWKDQSLKRGLEVRCRHLSLEKIPLLSRVNDFFNTLPIMLYATVPLELTDQVLNYVKISAFIGDKRLLGMLDESTYAKFLLKPLYLPLETFDLRKRSSEAQLENSKLLLRAEVKDIFKRDSFEPMDGLRLLPPVGGVIGWNIMSAPTEPYRIGAKFFYDAFTVIQPSRAINDWEIYLYHRLVTSKQYEFNHRKLLFFSGQ